MSEQAPPHGILGLTQHECDSHELFTDLPSNLFTDIDNTVHLGVITLEFTDHMVTPCDDASHTEQADNTRNET